jgi:hypothetical protein
MATKQEEQEEQGKQKRTGTYLSKRIMSNWTKRSKSGSSDSAPAPVTFKNPLNLEAPPGAYHDTV